MISELFHKATGVRQAFDLSVVETEEQKVDFSEKLEKMNIRMPKLVQFL